MSRNSTRKKYPRTNQPVEENANPFSDLITTNAIEFFNASIKDFKSRPKYSVINFCSGLELILKARLLKEHWSLIVKRPEEAALPRFQNGDFVSVSVDEALKRLGNIGSETFSQDETRCFERLRDHRNKSFISATMHIRENLMQKFWKKSQPNNAWHGATCIGGLEEVGLNISRSTRRQLKPSIKSSTATEYFSRLSSQP